jgi:hypothetical protein
MQYMYHDFQSLYDKEAPNALEKLCELIDDVYELIEQRGIKPRWSKGKNLIEYGFYIDSSDKQTSIFFGIWFEYWSVYGNPLSICLDWKTYTDMGRIEKLKKVVDSKKDIFLPYTEYEMFPTISFSLPFLNSVDNPIIFLEVLKSLLGDLSFDLYFQEPK